MSKYREYIITALAGIISGVFITMGIHNCNRQPIETKVERDTVTLHDTVPDIAPVPKDSVRLKYVTRWLPRAVHDTVYSENYAQNTVVIMHDTVAVQVPITSKHYGSKDYDAWVSGFEVSLDSIKLYKETQYITERVVVSKPPNKFALFIDAGVDYTFNDHRWRPRAGVELVLNAHKRIQFAAEGGMAITPLANGICPYAGGKVKIRVF